MRNLVHITLAASIKAAILMTMLYAPATVNHPITIHIDGAPVATLADPGVVYDLNANTIHIHTEQGLHCQAVTVFHDRFEGVEQ